MACAFCERSSPNSSARHDLAHIVKAGASVIICTYTTERWPLLKLAIGSVLGQRGVNEVVLVVDHEPALIEMARHEWGERVRVIHNENGQGLSGARNSGITVASSEIVAFLDDDAQAMDGWIENMLSAYDDTRVIGCGAATIADIKGPPPGWWPHEFDWVIGCSYIGMPSRRSTVRNLMGGNMSLRRQDVLAAGGFAEGVGRTGADAAGCEETDLCIRLTSTSPEAQIIYDPSVHVSHVVSADRLTWRYFRKRCYAEGRSKARVARRVGSARALSSERAYATRVLPLGILRSLRREGGGPRRAAAIACGLAWTAAGYLRGRLGGDRSGLIQPERGVLAGRG